MAVARPEHHGCPLCHKLQQPLVVTLKDSIAVTQWQECHTTPDAAILTARALRVPEAILIKDHGACMPGPAVLQQPLQRPRPQPPRGVRHGNGRSLWATWPLCVLAPSAPALTVCARLVLRSSRCLWRLAEEKLEGRGAALDLNLQRSVLAEEPPLSKRLVPGRDDEELVEARVCMPPAKRDALAQLLDDVAHGSVIGELQGLVGVVGEVHADGPLGPLILRHTPGACEP
mmetsp:Transcript_106115/g.300047  ORF Transcript_106115/g.300047 Transcript_106115/m.300047 type:complete len:230 (+) Transcript_106115:615-1304(+)